MLHTHTQGKTLKTSVRSHYPKGWVLAEVRSLKLHFEMRFTHPTNHIIDQIMVTLATAIV
jgi:hypothetical protein